MRALCVFAGAVALSTAALAQAYTPPPPPLTTGPCVPTKKDPCDTAKPAPAIPATADEFPFPGEAPGSVADIPKDGSVPAPPADAAASNKPSPAGQFPLPGGAQKPPESNKFPFPGEPDDASSSSSSSSSSSRSSSSEAEPEDKPTLKDAGSTGSTRFERRKLAVPEDKDGRELEDLDVSHYYMTTGNFVAAYNRAQDAVKLYPDDENAHYALAVSAEKLKKNAEAAAEYRAYLKMAPDGDRAKQAERALAKLPAR